ncbi:MAG: alpha-amylase family glycosyl hydrolase [Candidatus Promineifilaceae bacterium]
MAKDTPHTYRHLVIYEIYTRNHGPNGTFADVEADLPRIRSMGVDVVWFMPIHPIGSVQRKGSLGSPYAVSDYTQINPEYGSKADFARLVKTAHSLGLKVMIDVVYNHTAVDSVLVREYPHWFHQDEQGRPFTTVPEWSDVIDLKYGDAALNAYLIDALKGWVALGVDGFRCDVASIVPLEFWKQARREIAAVKGDVIWLAESVHLSFIEGRRRAGLSGHADAEIYEAFDLTYDYDIWSGWEAAVAGILPVSDYLQTLRLQDAIYPVHFVKMRCVENHDQPRIAARVPDRARNQAWTAFAAFNKGPFLIYGGQESENRHTPSLFEQDKVEWGEYALQPFLTKLAQLKKDPVMTTGQFTLLAGEPAILACWQTTTGGLLGVFNVSGRGGQLALPLSDGVYEDVLHGRVVTVSRGEAEMPASAAILRYHSPIETPLVYAPLLDYRS